MTVTPGSIFGVPERAAEGDWRQRGDSVRRRGAIRGVLGVRGEAPTLVLEQSIPDLSKSASCRSRLVPMGEQGGLDSESGSCPQARLLSGELAKTRRRRRAIFSGLGDVFSGNGGGLSSEPEPEPDNPEFNGLIFAEIARNVMLTFCYRTFTAVFCNLYELICPLSRGITSQFVTVSSLLSSKNF